MDILKDIKEIVKNDKEHHLEINIGWDGIRIFLKYDPDDICDESIVIPIEYTTLEEFAYIPDDEYRKRYNASDYGICLSEIKLIKDIMEYLESHKDEINKLCEGFDWKDRKG